MQKKLSVKSIKAIVLFSVSLVFLVMGLCFIGEGFDKKDNYYNSEYSYSANINAYVGGDAYNYIINGTYFAGYCALGGAMLISATIAGVTGFAQLESVEKEATKEEVMAKEEKIVLSDHDEILSNE